MKSIFSLMMVAVAMFSNAAYAAGGTNWIGSNLYYAAGLKPDTRVAFLKALQSAEVKVLRVWLDGQHNGGTKGTTINEYPGLEDGGVGTYNDQVLNYYDDFMIDAQKYGVKLMISMHSWNALSGGDTYSKKFGKSGFYTSEAAQQAFDNRIQHVLSHKHKTLGKTWSELGDYIFAFEPQNEAMIGLGQGFINQHASWQCERASTIKAAMGNDTGILVTTGGESWVAESVPEALFSSSCKDLDVVALHGYNEGDYSTSQLKSIVSKAQAANKMVIFQEWGACYFSGSCATKGSAMDAGQRKSNIKKWAAQIAEAGIPWMYWQILPNNDPHYGWDYEIGITETDLWNTFVGAAKSTSQTKSAWDWSKWLSTSGSGSGSGSNSTPAPTTTGTGSTATSSAPAHSSTAKKSAKSSGTPKWE